MVAIDPKTEAETLRIPCVETETLITKHFIKLITFHTKLN